MKCPGQDSRFWKQDAITESKCPKCGRSVEFFKDDTARRCPHCGHRFVNPDMDFGCAAYCQFAEQCLGSLPEEVKDQQQDLLKDRVGMEMRKTFKTDLKRIRHATTVARYAERIGKDEGGNLGVIIMAAYLHDIGIVEAERKHASTAPTHQHQEGPPIARQILEKLGADEDLVGEVCDIVGHHHAPRDQESLNFKVVYDADLITNLEEEQAEEPRGTGDLSGIVDRSLLTESGRRLAREVLRIGS
jgi:DNA-directed RNA polymerase subunit RPC12/RpoP/HD superfamily phosphohydrolase YqeK